MAVTEFQVTVLVLHQQIKPHQMRGYFGKLTCSEVTAKKTVNVRACRWLDTGVNVYNFSLSGEWGSAKHPR